MTWEDAEQSAINREDWRRSVAQCVHLSLSKSLDCNELKQLHVLYIFISPFRQHSIVMYIIKTLIWFNINHTNT